MRKRVVIDGTPDEVKVSCPVWRGGKSGDNLKGLPITIGHHLRWLRTKQSDSGSAIQGARKPHCLVWIGEPWEKRSQPKSANDGASAADAR